MTTREADNKSPSDQIRIIHATAMAESTRLVLLIQAITRSILAVLVVLAGAYLLISQIPVPDQAVGIGGLVLGAYFGIEGAAAFVKRNGSRKE